MFCCVVCILTANNTSKPLLSFCIKRVTVPQRPLCTNSDEVKLAEEACKKYGFPAPTIFSKVIDKSIPADIIYEDDKVNNQRLQKIYIFFFYYDPFEVESRTSLYAFRDVNKGV